MQIDWIPIRYVHTVCHHMFEFITEYNPAQDSQTGQYEILSTLGVRGKPDISLIEFTNDHSHSSQHFKEEKHERDYEQEM